MESFRSINTKKLGRYLTSTKQTTLNFDSFIFSDNITKSRIVIKNAKQCFSTLHQHTHPSNKHQDLYSESMKTMKSTKYFQKESLKHKLFKYSQGQKQVSAETSNKAKKQLSKKMIDWMSKKQLREHLQSKRPINPQIIKLQHYGCKLKKQDSNPKDQQNNTHNKQKVNEYADFLQYKTRNQLHPKDLQFQNDLHEQINNFLNNYIKTNSSYLIRPQYHRELYEKLYQACSRKNPAKHHKKRQYKSTNDIISQCIFIPVQTGQKAKMLEREILQSLNKPPENRQEEELMFAVENNLFFDMEMLISMNKNLINTKDKKGNNLLHLAAKSRNSQFFAFLLKKLGHLALACKNNMKKTPYDIAKLYGQLEIVKICDNYDPYSEE